MPASTMAVYTLMERMHEAVCDVAKGCPRHEVAEAVVRVAAAVVAGLASAGQEANALVVGATIFAERAGSQLLQH